MDALGFNLTDIIIVSVIVLSGIFAFARGPAFGARAAQMGGYDVSGLGKVRYNGP